MLKKFINIFVILITLFYFSIDLILAYEYQDSKNESSVNGLIREIYDAKEQYEDLFGKYDVGKVDVIVSTTNTYWWPIGSVETVENNGKLYATGAPETVTITSNFGYRNDPVNQQKKQYHSGLDIAGGRGIGQVNIVASKSGVVVYPKKNDATNCPTNAGYSNCGGGYGNYVIIQHTDGNYTLYAHMDANSITVKAGESVEQGQVIGKMGSSGYSTGAHLHFEVREGQNTSSSAVDPLKYISKDNPREVSSGSSDFLKWLQSWEGHTKIVGDSYVVQDVGDGVRTVGSGITLEYNASRFKKYGIDVSKYKVGDKIPIKIVDQIKLERIDSDRSSVEKVLSDASITLEEYQIEALISRKYNYNISGFTSAYKKYGNTQKLYENYMSTPITARGQVMRGLVRRREAEWKLFNQAIYLYNNGTEKNYAPSSDS